MFDKLFFVIQGFSKAYITELSIVIQVYMRDNAIPYTLRNFITELLRSYAPT